MRSRFNLASAPVLGILLTMALTACTDELPTLSGGDPFGGARPATMQAILPAEAFLTPLGEFTGYTGPRNFPVLVAASRFGGTLDAHVLGSLPELPTSVSYTFAGTSRTDSVFTIVGSDLVLRVDTAFSRAEGPIGVQVWELAEGFDPRTSSWELAVDSAGERRAWRTPGGTRGALVGEASVPRLTDTIRVSIGEAGVRRLSAPGSPGFLLTTTGMHRIEIAGVSTATTVRPEGADTVVALPVQNATGTTFVFTPQPPTDPAAWEIGGIGSSRVLFRVDLDQQVPSCAGCPPVALRAVTLNEVAIVFDPLPVPAGFGLIGPMKVTAHAITEPELGRFAPVGEIVNEAFRIDQATQGIVYAGTRYAPTDPVLTVPITSYVARSLASDSTTLDLALIGTAFAGSAALVNASAPTFGEAWFVPRPRLRIVYTVPARPALP